MRKAGIVARFVCVAGLGGWWLFQECQLWTLVQAKNQFRMVTAQGLPAIVYVVLWAFGALAGAVAHDLFHAKIVLGGCRFIAGAFAFIIATGTPEQSIGSLSKEDISLRELTPLLVSKTLKTSGRSRPMAS